MASCADRRLFQVRAWSFKMFYFKAPGFCIHKDFITADWGEFVRYVEVADDQYAMRQVEVFQGGRMFRRYNRSYWCDDFGMLVGAQVRAASLNGPTFSPSAEEMTAPVLKWFGGPRSDPNFGSSKLIVRG